MHFHIQNFQFEPKMWNLVSKCNFLRFWPPQKSVFELMTNLKFSFSVSAPGSVHNPPKPIFLFLSFQTFKDTLKMLQITFYPQIQQEKSLKWPSILKSLGYAAEIFGIFYSQWDYQMVNISRFLKFLTWHGFDEFGWNDPFVKWWYLQALFFHFF